MKYKTKPVIVTAYRIVDFGTVPAANGGIFAQVDDGESRSIAELTPEMMARYTPVVGDYLVKQDDGYLYLNPKAVFERKYTQLLITEEMGVTVDRHGNLIGDPLAIQEFMEFCAARPSLVNCE